MNEFLIPEFFGHGYLVIEDSVVSYKCAEVFYGEGDSGIKYNDPDIGIEWPFELIGGKDKLIISEKDLNLLTFTNIKEMYHDFMSRIYELPLWIYVIGVFFVLTSWVFLFKLLSHRLWKRINIFLSVLGIVVILCSDNTGADNYYEYLLCRSNAFRHKRIL